MGVRYGEKTRRASHGRLATVSTRPNAVHSRSRETRREPKGGKPRSAPLFEFRERSIRINHAPANQGEERLDAADRVHRHAEIVFREHREVGELARRKRAALGLVMREPRFHWQRLPLG